MTVDLAALAKLASEATPGDWVADDRDIRLGVTHRPDPNDEFDGWKSEHLIYDEGGHSEADAAYIAAASPDVVLALVRVALTARAVAKQAEADDDFDGQFIEYLVPAEPLDALRAALEALR